MPFAFDPARCAKCPLDAQCVEDRRDNPVRGRKTQFRVLQNNALECSFEEFVPGYEEAGDTQSFSAYLKRWRSNLSSAAEYLFPGVADLTYSQIAKTEGDALETLLAAGLWNAAADWNHFMETGSWDSPLSRPDAVACSDRRIALVRLPRGYDVTLLFEPTVRKNIEAFQHGLRKGGMELNLSAPDIVGVRLPHDQLIETQQFSRRIPHLKTTHREQLELSYKLLEGRIASSGLLLALAVKKSVRSDRLYQPLFEANVLKYLVQEVLRGSALRFLVFVMNMEGAAVRKHYRAASLFSLLRGGRPERAVDDLSLLDEPRRVLNLILSHIPYFPV